MPAVVSTLRDAQGRAIVTVPIAMRSTLMALDDLMRAHAMQFEILCETCHAMYPNDPNRWTVRAEHGGDDGSLNGLTCGCTRRKFVASF